MTKSPKSPLKRFLWRINPYRRCKETVLETRRHTAVPSGIMDSEFKVVSSSPSETE